MSELHEVVDDLSAFADDESGAAVDPDGSFILQRNGREISGQLHQRPGHMVVELDGAQIPYHRFLTHNLARLDVLATRLVERRSPVAGFVDSNVRLQTSASKVVTGSGLQLIDDACGAPPPFSSRVLFVTADAGHGKTALLLQHQVDQATRFIKGDSHYLFWHLDLQGRQLLRLSEALMGDLADLRLAGLWMPAVVRLMRRGLLVVGIDGFDELAAEQGGADALGGLASLVSQLEGRGVVVAASRRTFFSTDDYLRRGGMIRRLVPDPCEFDQLELSPWGEADVRQYFHGAEFSGTRLRDPSGMYDQILDSLGGDRSHPLITRPFLVTQIARASALYGLSPDEFFQTPDDPYSGVATVVNAFVKREVTEKWKVRETGEPYLSEEQHLALLADIAEEMHRNKSDRLGLDIIETIAAVLMEQWGTDAALRQHVIEMVRMHVLLVAAPGTNQSQRMFDHPEFRDYFIAYSLRERLRKAMEGETTRDLVRFLSISQLSDSTARYVCSMLDRTESRVRTVLTAMEVALAAEWKPTYLHQNLGTLIPFLISGVKFSDVASFTGKAIYSSLAFEGSRIANFTFAGGTFVNVSLRGVTWEGVGLEEMALGELQLDHTSEFRDVWISRCSLEGVHTQGNDDELTREYAPQRVKSALQRYGFRFIQEELPLDSLPDVEDSYQVRLLRKLLRMFYRTTTISDEALRTRFGSDFAAVEAKLIPTLLQNEVLLTRQWRGAGNGQAWSMAIGLEDFIAAEGGTSPLSSIWRELQAGG